MIELFFKIKEIWNEYNFEIIACALILFFLFMFIYRKIKGEQGSWSDSFFYDYSVFNKKYKNSNHEEERKPIRTDSKGEIECRRVLEKIFKKPFNKARPNFLRNEINGGHNLELDCFNEELSLALEYDGQAHFKYIPFFHKNKEHFLNQQYRDELKNRMCKDNGIYLIRVPYTVKIEDIETYIIKEIKKAGYYRQR